MKDNTLNYAAYGEQIGISEATVKHRLGELKKSGLIVRVGATKKGIGKSLINKKIKKQYNGKSELNKTSTTC